MGPRQMRAWPAGAKYPMDIHLTPYFSMGMKSSCPSSPSASGAKPSVAVMIGTEGP